MSSKVLVTGGTGYLGTQLIAALLRDGHDVRATLRSLDGEPGGARPCAVVARTTPALSW